MIGEPELRSDHGLWERLPVAMCRTALDGSILDVNPAFVELFRSASRESLLQTRAEALYVDPADRVRGKDLVRDPNVRQGFEAQMRRLDGTTFSARETSRVYHEADAGALFVESSIEDITERRSARRALLASELRYRRLFESAKDGILILDAESAEIVDVNPFLCDLLELSRREILGRKIWEIGPFKDVPASRINFRELQRTEYIRYEDLPLESSAGHPIAVEFVSNVYQVDGANVIQCNVRDITARKESAAEHARLIRAVEQTADSIIMTDPQGTIVYVNPAFERLSGWRREEAIGENPRILKSGKQDETFYQRMWEVLGRGEVWAGRIVNRRKDGQLFEEEATISPVRDAAGQVVNYVSVNRDLSRESRLEQQLSQAQKMEAVGRLAAGVAHDFNNLLGVISGFGEIVRRELPDGSPLRDDMDRILEAAERAAGLTRQLLALGRRQVPQTQVLDLNAVVCEAEKLLLRIVGANVELVTRLDPALGRVRADPGQIEQILMNLVLNARDAMPEGGRIAIETRNVDPDTVPVATHSPTPPSPWVLLTVADAGTGMDSTTQARAFEPFFTTKEVGKGSGLGLSTVYGIVSQSGGHLWINSEVGAGTTFEIYLPRVDEEVPPPARKGRPEPLPRSSETVLLVEDEEALRVLLRRVLEAHGYTVLAACDGAEALKIHEAHEGPIQIMVTDVVMPGLAGPRVAELVAAARPEIKVLFISGYSDEDVARRGLAGSGQAFLGKPFRLETLPRRVRELLDAG